MSPDIFIAILAGTERQQWVHPDLMQVLFYTMIQNMKSKRIIQLRVIYSVFPVSNARNVAVEEFLRSGAHWLVMIDNDTVPSPDFMTAIFEASQDQKIIGFPCPMLMLSRMPHHFGVPDSARIVFNVGRRLEDGLNYELLDGLPATTFEADAVGGACFALRKSVIDVIDYPWFELSPFQKGVIISGITNEDFGFCEKAKARGIKIFISGSYPCQHHHTVDLGRLHPSFKVRWGA